MITLGCVPKGVFMEEEGLVPGLNYGNVELNREGWERLAEMWGQRSEVGQ